MTAPEPFIITLAPLSRPHRARLESKSQVTQAHSLVGFRIIAANFTARIREFIPPCHYSIEYLPRGQAKPVKLSAQKLISYLHAHRANLVRVDERGTAYAATAITQSPKAAR